MIQENKKMADQADCLRSLMARIITELPEDEYADLWERAAEADSLLKQVISEFTDEENKGGFVLY